MIDYELRREEGILIMSPEGPLSAEDFAALGREVDAYIVEDGALMGIMIDAESFPGWEDFAGLISHLKFVRNNHQDVDRVAAVTDNRILSVIPQIIDHFVSAEVRHFDYGRREEALAWLRGQLTRDGSD